MKSQDNIQLAKDYFCVEKRVGTSCFVSGDKMVRQ